MRDLYAAVYRTKKMYGKGFVWLNAWMERSIFFNDDGTTNVDAAKGAEGSLGFISSRAGIDNAVHQKFMHVYLKLTSRDACDAPLKDNGAPYCLMDVNDINGTTLDEKGTNGVDGALAYAVVAHRLLTGGAVHSAVFLHQLGAGSSIDSVTASNVYAGLLNLGRFDGVGGADISLNSHTGTVPLCTPHCPCACVVMAVCRACGNVCFCASVPYNRCAIYILNYYTEAKLYCCRTLIHLYPSQKILACGLCRRSS